MSAQRRVIVLGGGLAGITAALDCAQAGAQVTLLEVRRRLGGAAYSFEREGLEMDNGQHVFLRCCHAYRALLARLGSEQLTSLQPRLRIPVLRPGAPAALLARNGLPAPAHLAGTLLRYPPLRPRERLSAVRAALALGRLDPSDPRLDEQTLGEWLRRHGQSERALRALWDLIALPTLNVPAAQASLGLGAFVFRTALLERADAGDIGVHEAPLSRILGEPAQRALAAAGVDVRLGWRAERIERGTEGLTVHARGERLAAAVTILALPHVRAGQLLTPLAPGLAARVGALGSSPIVNLHVVFDRPVLAEPFAAGVQTPVQYLFDRTAAAGAPDGRQYLAVSLSGAQEEMRMSVEELRARYVPALRELLPRARDAELELFLATREHAATFRAGPGQAALRPGPRTEVPGLLLAGAWTDTGWPATLEGAVLSGQAAAQAALERLARSEDEVRANGRAPAAAAARR